ncbi:MAG: ribosomal protein S18-alanine N-acetyltransferase [Candidatus Poribacteria bacterium]|nr:ribosomal protein S18-alanine N-acetyltransferase [Candidatus Poribacteria bacterium]
MATQKPLQNLIFEPMRLSDLQQVLQIENECFEDPWSATYFSLSLKRPRSYEYFYVARCEDTVMGYIVFVVLYEEAHILNIAVSATYQRQGIGKYLLASALDKIQTLDGQEVFLEVAVSNLPAQCLYRQFGFRIYSIRKNYYGRHKDAYLFRKGAPETDAT